MTEHRHTNRLSGETSPYLLQHAHNPVDWYPWGPEAFDRARHEDKPLLLSVGYSACHWCHVMERESFEDEATAALMNDLFVSVKVDREERPDVDQIYMQAVQSMTGHGGWPMTVFLAPDGVPFYGGTYFPPEDRHGMPAFPKLLRAVADAYQTRRSEVVQSGRELLAQMRQGEGLRQSATLLTDEILMAAYQAISRDFDERDGGLAHAPKFPQPMIWEGLLRFWGRTKNPRALDMLRKTLTRMARGGMYDQLGGGFHRYSVDAHWLVPHFEKMLYDNAQLAILYLHGWLATGDPEYRRVTEETLDYLVREMRHPAGGFYSATDADSEGVEGKFFVWTADEVRAALPDADVARAALAYWGLDDGPNFEGENILCVPRDPAEVATALGILTDELGRRIQKARATLLEVRRRRVPPGLDDKVLAGWNGLTLAALAEAGRALGRPDYVTAAVDNAAFLTTAMMDGPRLCRSWKDGTAKIKGYLEDHATVGVGLLHVYEATFDRTWLDASRRLAEETIRLFWDADGNAFFDTGVDQEALVVRPRNLFDNAVPSGAAVAIDWLFRLAVHTGDDRYEALALRALRPMADLMTRYPSGFGRYLCALDFHLGPVTEVALIWPAGAGVAAASALLETVFGRYAPNRIVAGAPEGAGQDDLPLLAQRPTVRGQPTAYVCRRYVCQAPTTDAGDLARQLEAGV
ncbi:MAG TPA: thioredoxin domain-containing protein [Candidatus Limnocylindrales bacterium]|nr:thioredoxin domain-containing protein [Candidatus Limnocylindrales bacterium]